MTQMFDTKGNVIPVTLVEAGPCTILQKKTKAKEGYDALQLGFVKIEKKNKIGKSMKGKEFRYIKESRNGSEGKIGDQINVSIFVEGDTVTVAGTSKGKGFQGGVKRHGFHGRNATHGAQHVIKGRKMPGRMGFDRVTVKNLKIAKIDAENNTLALKGAIPGHKGTLLEIKG